MRVIILRSNPVTPDPRVEKVVRTLESFGYQVKILAWNRLDNRREKNGFLKIEKRVYSIRWFNIRASFGNGLKNLIPLLYFQISLLIWLSKHKDKYDVIHACDFDTVIPAWISKVIYKKKYVYDIFDYYVDAFAVPKILKGLLERIDIFMINAANAVIIVNESRKVQIARSNPKKLYIIHNSPVDTFKEEYINANILLSNSDKPKFVYIGILNSGRLLEEVIEVFQEHKEWELHIGGFGSFEDRIREIASENQNIFFYGKVPYDITLKIENMCNVLFAVYNPNLDNHQYSSPNKLYEAMMLGKPIIVAKGTGIDKIVESHNIGFSIEYSKKDFVKAARSLSDNKELVNLISKNAKQLFADQFSWNIMESRLEELYKSL